MNQPHRNVPIFGMASHNFSDALEWVRRCFGNFCIDLPTRAARLKYVSLTKWVGQAGMDKLLLARGCNTALATKTDFDENATLATGDKSF